MPLSLPEYPSESYVPTINKWLDSFRLTQKSLYYRDQNIQSIMGLMKLVETYNPTKIIEIGTSPGMSLRTWVEATAITEIIAIDLTFLPLFKYRELVPLDLSRVKLIEQDALTVKFSTLWTSEDRIILYIDTHSTENFSIIAYILETVVTMIPKDSVVVIDDFWYSCEVLTDQNIDIFLDNIQNMDSDPLECGCAASYWEGGSFYGSFEVLPLVRWANKQRVHLQFFPEAKFVFFETNDIKYCNDCNPSVENDFFISLNYNPVELKTEDFLFLNDEIATTLCREGAGLYRKGNIADALCCFDKASRISSFDGIPFFITICLARIGEYNAAKITLENRVKDLMTFPKAKKLYQDLQKRYLLENSMDESLIDLSAFIKYGLVNTFLDCLKMAKRPVYIWGASAGGEKLLSFLKYFKYHNINGFIDRNPEKEGCVIDGYRVYSSDIIEAGNNKSYILIASIFSDEIEAFLQTKGFKRGMDYWSLLREIYNETFRDY